MTTQAFATVQSRSTVAVESPIASAVSSTGCTTDLVAKRRESPGEAVRPAKERSSTNIFTWQFRTGADFWAAYDAFYSEIDAATRFGHWKPARLSDN